MSQKSESKDHFSSVRIAEMSEAAEKELEAQEEQTETAAENLTERDLEDAFKKSNPSVLGLGGFGAAVLIFQAHYFQLLGSGPTMWIALIVGGLLQLVAGCQEFYTGNNFGYGVFGVFGGLWSCFGLILLSEHVNWFHSTNQDMGWLMIVFGFFTAMWLFPTFYMDLALFAMFAVLFMAFAFSIGHLFFPPIQAAFGNIAALLFTFGGLLAWYIMAHVIYKDIFIRDVLPVGQAPIVFWRAYLEKRRQRAKP